MEKLLSIANEFKASVPLANDESGHGRYEVRNPNPERILVHNIPFIFTCDAEDHISILKNHSLVIERGVILEVLPAEAVKDEGFDLVYDAGKRGGIVVTPGLINTHAHIHMYLLRSAMMLDEGEGIDETIAAMAVWQRHETDESLAIAGIGDLTEQQKAGITTTLTHGPSFVAAEVAAQATKHNLINAVSAVSNSRPDNTPAMVEKLLDEQAGYFSKPAIALHYLYKATEAELKKISSLIAKHNALLTFHMAESELVANETIKNHGCREVELLARYGLLNSHSLASHALHIEDDEIGRLIAGGVGIAHLPTSNAIHKSGTFKFWAFDAKGGAPFVALGTDSVVSKNRLDLLTEAYQARITHLYQRTIKFGSLFKMMTTNGARVLNLSDRGKILPGNKADQVFWKLKDRGFIPYDTDNPITLLGNLITHGGRAVRDLMINGIFVVKDRRHRYIDESFLLAKTQEAHTAMRKRVEF